MGCVVQAYSFDTCPSGFTAGGVNSDWQCGTPPANVGPGADHTGGGSLWATKLSGNAKNCQDSTLASPVIDLSMVAGQMVVLRFWHWDEFRECTCLCTDSSSYSGGVLEVKTNGTNWTILTPTTGYGNGTQKINCALSSATCSTCTIDEKLGFGAAGPQKVWIQSEYDISAYANASFEFRLHYASHGGYGCYPDRDGWYIDDIEIATMNVCP